MRSCENIIPSRNAKITLSLSTNVNHALVANFNVVNMTFNAIRENKFLAKISGFTVANDM